MRKLILACTTSAIALISAPAFAQDAPAPDASAQEAPADEATDDAAIVVTGSLLARDGSRAPTPVTAVTSDSLVQIAPSNIADALNKLPVFAGSSNQNSGLTFAATAAPAGNYLNLRGLGSQRMLVLLNGSRVTPTTNSNAVDTNMLPNLLISRVDVVTGGASAAYGSDAVTGVVNFILDEKFQGIKGVAQAGISSKGDAFSYRYGAAFGTSLGDRIHIIGSYEHYKSDGVPSLNDRSWATGAPILTGTGTAGLPYTQTPDARTNVMTYGGYVFNNTGGAITTGPLGNVQFRPDGTLAPFNHGLPVNSATEIGGDGIIYSTTLAARLKTDQAFLRAAIDLTDTIEFVAQGTYGRSVSGYDTQAQNHRPGSNRSTMIFPENAYLRPEVASAITNAGLPSIQIGRFFRDIPLMTQRSVTEFYNIQAGLKGEIGSDWRWDVNYVHGRSTLDFAASEFDSRRYFAAIDAVRDPASGRPVCRITLTDPTFLPGCVPMNVIGEGNISQESYNWVRGESKHKIVNRMDYVNANIRGDLFDLPAGPVMLALGAEYRHQKLDQTSNADPASLSTPAQRAAYFGNIRAVPGSALKFLVANVGIASGSQTVKEAYGELLIPVFKDQSFAQNLDLNLAARITDYKTSGTVKTWKAGISWIPVDGLRFRGTQSRDIAAPSLYDLYAGANVRNLGVQDPLTGQLVVPQIINQGNIDLQPETADTTVLGVVLTPRALPGLTVSIDAYRIKIKGAIQTTSETAQLSECHASGGTAPICDSIIRPFPYSNSTPANAPTQIFVLPQNLAALTTKGIDFEVNYRTSLDGLLPSVGGNLDLRAFVNYLDTYNTQAGVTQPVIQRAGRRLTSAVDAGGIPKWRALLSQTYSNGGFTLSLTERFTGTYQRVIGVTAAGFPNKAPNRIYVDLNLSHDILADKGELFLNVQNLFDVKPPIFQTGAATDLHAPTDKTIYDVIGRYFTAGVRVKF